MSEEFEKACAAAGVSQKFMTELIIATGNDYRDLAPALFRLSMKGDPEQALREAKAIAKNESLMQAYAFCSETMGRGASYIAPWLSSDERLGLLAGQ
ncbi:hypothetical protein CUU95_18445 [Vreelandella alkaliphila]|uniref:hypothetical protein n=1 Tax=Vreelandella alkaliphila TaxID=272774 RepID=UPI000EA11E53|nr:hypothetical protein [Halomonas alkaliphila]AYF35612.1 hypothetical protein CUU95_18125 [Halomonas alkaliphila]AYF35671.1 hypothetical protein CUU95_18445 [Halomonas alkaliphila]